VRRGEGADAQPRGARDRLDEGDGRALAVGAGDGDDVLAGAPEAHADRDLAHALQAHGDLLRMRAQLVRQPLSRLFMSGIVALSIAAPDHYRLRGLWRLAFRLRWRSAETSRRLRPRIAAASLRSRTAKELAECGEQLEASSCAAAVGAG
jgi:hypothetical protein